MNPYLLLTVVLLATGFCQAQTMSHAVIGSTGASYTAGNTTSTITVGVVATATYAGNRTLTQGFQQPAIVASAITETLPEGVVISVFPNPVALAAEVKCTLPAGQTLGYQLTDVQGRILQRGWLKDGSTWLDLAGLPAAMYLLSVAPHQQSPVATYRLIKQ